MVDLPSQVGDMWLWFSKDNILTLAVSSTALLASIVQFLYTQAKNRKDSCVILRREEKELNGSIRMIHVFMFLILIISVITTAAAQLACYIIEESFLPLIGLVLQCIAMIETQCVLAESFLNLNTRKKACTSKTFIRGKTILFTIGIPAVITMPLNFALNFYLHTQVPATHIPNLLTNNLTDASSSFTLSFISGNFDNEGLNPEGIVGEDNVANTEVIKHTVHDDNSDIFPSIFAQKEQSFCWMTWPSTSLTVTFAVAAWGCTSTMIIAVIELLVLRAAERKGQLVSLEEWFALISRPIFSVLICLKWLAITSQWYSHSCVYSVYVSWLLTPALLHTITGPKRSRIYGHIIGKPRTRKNKTTRPRQDISDNYTRNGIGYTSLNSPDQGNMIQVHEPSRSHVQGDVIINQRLSDFVRERFDATSSEKNRLSNMFGEGSKSFQNDEVKGMQLTKINEIKTDFTEDDQGMGHSPKPVKYDEETEYGIIQPNHADEPDLDLSKCDITTENRTSVFDDSDYDEVLDFMTSPKDGDTEAAVGGSKEINLQNESSSKRSSASSTSDSVTSATSGNSTSGIESGEEKATNPKYANLDIAKILHTRKRIHRTLYTPPEVKDLPKEETQTNATVGKKKGNGVLKRHTHYGTVGRRSKAQSSSQTRHSSCSRPSSTGENDYLDLGGVTAGDYATFDPVRARRQTTCITNTEDSWFTLDSRKSRIRSRESDSEGSDSNRNSLGTDQNRWSRISSNSQNSDKTLLSPHKGPWKAFRKFVNNGTSPRTQSHEEKKATIRLVNGNLNNNNNNTELDTLNKPNSRLSCIEVGKVPTRAEAGEQITKQSSYSCVTSGEMDANAEYSYSPTLSTPEHRSNSLMRRLSRKSTSRGRKARRSSLPTQSAWDVRSGNWRESSKSDPTTSSLDLSDSQSERSEVETKVMASLERTARSSSVKAKPVSSKPSLKKRLMSFTKKRSPSQSRNSVDGKTKSESSDGRQMNKALSYSSPQLSVFAVNGKDRNKLQF
uniref:uncharacterized protein LOC100187501 n=1 Tax=Ciona intestinalis TaxID=7719 RepID=UPI000180C5E3|nr:uncharacterized protein LOC100187501 [Ciona intestinalis]|eukprot:XP_026693404.1 uncharacterized protein LOC100187501 [Ciona intestinalis]